MSSGEITTVLSVIAAALAVLSFCGAVWRIWRDRPRLIFYVAPITFTNLPKGGPMKMLRVMACNVGYRPIVLTKFVALGDTSMMTMGINDEPAAAFGIEDQCFPSLLNPGDSLKVHPIGIDALTRNATDPKDDKTHFDPYRYFAFVDSFERLHVMDADDVMFHARIDRARKRLKGWRKLHSWLAKKMFLRRAKRRLRKRF